MSGSPPRRVAWFDGLAQAALFKRVGMSALRRAVVVVALLLVSVGLFSFYLHLSQTEPMNADGASQALQAWDLLHGNVLLSGWTVSDVPFYTNELLILALAEAINGLNGDAVHIGAAVLYTLLVLLVAAVAKGRATGREAVARVAIAVAVMAVPAVGMGTSVLPLSPDHTGTAVPVLLMAVLVDRFWGRSWLPYVAGAVLLLGQISDPLMLYVGVAPVVVVCGLRLWRRRSWRGPEAAFAGAAIASAVLARGILAAISA